ncbi:Fe2+-enterobactin ABC transporter substrate-binding protein [Pantoea sp. BAV 3049]|uniref:Fe2+-enterobactin ABC transporter substrate-binding protein n=1 Tax=Pantoea sp. BAV 3049 TaxID=2654188 RepID=UPI00131CBEF4|nr:Fe2+-enterobactin ABC transporter substrate-binding protein [Pantoea sp. BAV 3049]
MRLAVLRLPSLLLCALILSPSGHAADGWPRSVPGHERPLVLQHQPQRIVSTSVTLTGSLLAIGAPVVASAATMPGQRFADKQGFFRQWGDIAVKQDVKRLYSGEPNLETIAAEKPDLIVVSATGNDSAIAFYDRLSVIAPTLVINYDDKSWQQVERELAQATGNEAGAERSIQSYAQREAEVKAKLALPPQPVSALVYNPHAHIVNLWTGESAQGKMLVSLGFTLATPPERILRGSQRLKRKDIIPLSGETLATGITGRSVLMFATDDSGKAALLSEPLVAGSGAIRAGHVWTLGYDSFRLDYYSANHLLTRLEQLFSKS